MVVVVVEIGNQTVVWHLGHIGRGSGFPGEVRGDSCNWNIGITIWGIGWWWLVLFLQYLHILTSNPSLKEP